MFGRKKEGVECLGIPQEALDDIFEGVVKQLPVVFHGGCVGCLLSMTGENRTLSGIEYCKGCMYFSADWNLPNKSLRCSLQETLSGGFGAANIRSSLEEAYHEQAQ